MKARLLAASVLVVVSLLFGAVAARSQNIANYTFTTNTATFASIVGQSGTTSLFTPASASNDDGYFSSIPIGFTFVYMGVQYTTVNSNCNGFIAFNSSTTTSWVADMPGTTYNIGRPAICPFWGDLRLINGASTHAYRTDGNPGSRVFTIEWNTVEWPYSSGTNSVSFQVKLYEATGAVEFNYDQPATSTGSQTQGIGLTGQGTNIFSCVTDNNFNAVSTSTATYPTIRPNANYRMTFTPPAAPSAPSNLSFTNVLLTQMTLNWQDNSNNESGF